MNDPIFPISEKLQQLAAVFKFDSYYFYHIDSLYIYTFI